MLNTAGCAVLQSGDKEDVLGRILDARHPSGALLGTDTTQRPSPVESLLRFGSLVNQIHPERCMDGRAQEAFGRASHGYEALCAMDSGDVATANAIWEKAKSSASSSPWWEGRSLADMQSFLEFRSAALNSLYTEIAPKLGATGIACVEHLNSLIEHAERTCEHLDKKGGISRSHLWHAKPQLKRSVQEAAVHYVDLLCHLRVMHCYCLLQGQQYLHMADLHAASPLSRLGNLLEESLQREKTNEKLQQELAAGNAGDIEDAEVDPLDRFMASIEAEVVHEGMLETEKRDNSEITATNGSTTGSNEADGNGPCQKGIPAPTGASANSLQGVHGKSVHLTAEAADAEKRAAASALLAEEGKACAQRDLQNHLLGELASDESDVEQK